MTASTYFKIQFDWFYIIPRQNVGNFNLQEYFICDWWFNFDCADAEGLYSLNEEIAAEREAASGDQVLYHLEIYIMKDPQIFI